LAEHTLTSREKELLDALRQGGQWMDRKTLAGASGKNTLSPHDRSLLEDLQRRQLIESRTVVVGISKKFEYRALNDRTD